MNTDSEAVRTANELRLVNALQVLHPMARRVAQVDVQLIHDAFGMQRRQFMPGGPDWDTDIENIELITSELSLIINEMPHRVIGEPIDVGFHYPTVGNTEVGMRKSVSVSVRVDEQATRTTREQRIMSALQEVYPVTRQHIGDQLPSMPQRDTIVPRVFVADNSSWDTPAEYTITRILHALDYVGDRIVDQPIDVNFHYPTDEERSRGFVNSIKILMRTHAPVPTSNQSVRVVRTDTFIE